MNHGRNETKIHKSPQNNNNIEGKTHGPPRIDPRIRENKINEAKSHRNRMFGGCDMQNFEITPNRIFDRINILEGREIIERTVLFKDDEEKRKLSRQFEALKIMRTGNFLQIFDHYSNEEKIVVRFEKYLETLDQFLDKLRTQQLFLNEMGILTIFIPVLKAVYSLHLKEFIHRYITRYHIFIGNSGNVMLGGLELIRKYKGQDSNTTNFNMIHLPPEASTSYYDGKVDVFSLGLLLYELCTLQNMSLVVKNNLLTKKDISNSLPPHLSGSHLHRLILSMIQNDPQKRPSSIEVIKDEFINFAIIQYRGNLLYSGGEVKQEYLSKNSNSILVPITENSSYNVIKTLGSGSFGKVDLVSYGSQEFALKSVYGRDGISPINEIKYSGVLIHDNIITPYFPLCSKDPNDDPFYICLERCANNLKYYIGKLSEAHKHFSLNGVFKVLCSLINALFWIHKNNLAHRDVKCENVLITSNGCVVLSDFGAIQEPSDDGLFHTIIGTPGYMSYEILGSNYTNSVDLFALGCLMYHMCTLENPPTFKDLSKLADQGQNFRYKLPDGYDGVPELQYLVDRMTVYNPDERITIDELMENRTFINYNISTRTIPFISDNDINHLMYIEQFEPPILSTTSSYFLSVFLDGNTSFPNSRFTYSQLPKQLNDDYIGNLEYLFPTLSELQKDERSRDQSFCSGPLLKSMINLIEHHFKLLGFRPTVIRGKYRLTPTTSTMSWKTIQEVRNANRNIIMILSYIAENNPRKDVKDILAAITSIFGRTK